MPQIREKQSFQKSQHEHVRSRSKQEMSTSRQSISRKPQASSSNRQTKQELNNKAWEEFVSYQLLKNANSAKYGHVI